MHSFPLILERLRDRRHGGRHPPPEVLVGVNLSHREISYKQILSTALTQKALSGETRAGDGLAGDLRLCPGAYFGAVVRERIQRIGVSTYPGTSLSNRGSSSSMKPVFASMPS